MTEIYIENYTEKSFVLLGDTRPHKENIKKQCFFERVLEAIFLRLGVEKGTQNSQK